MNNSIINSIVMRCLSEDSFLNLMERNPLQGISAYKIDDESREELLKFKWHDLRKFRAFVTSVKHNFLWSSYPITRSILRKLDLEMEVSIVYNKLGLPI
jgi:hypothetical protein